LFVVNFSPVELLLNLAWVLIACSAVLSWFAWRRSSNSTLVPELGRGLFVVGCILVLLFPVISITDDLAQTPVLAEGNKLQDVLKAPESPQLQLLVTAALVQPLSPSWKVKLWREARDADSSLQPLSCWNSNIEKRPPPRSL
jgi:hypothetical protein